VTRGHAIAAAFAAWVLIVPPPLSPHGTYQHDPDPNAPLSKWENFGTFGGASDCERERGRLSNFLKDPTMLANEQQEPHWYADYAKKRLEASKCVEDDDPRLKSHD
jgi:hypothetical protein